jgi:hypothetical protein
MCRGAPFESRKVRPRGSLRRIPRPWLAWSCLFPFRLLREAKCGHSGRHERRGRDRRQDSGIHRMAHARARSPADEFVIGPTAYLGNRESFESGFALRSREPSPQRPSGSRHGNPGESGNEATVKPAAARNRVRTGEEKQASENVAQKTVPFCGLFWSRDATAQSTPDASERMIMRWMGWPSSSCDCARARSSRDRPVAVG